METDHTHQNNPKGPIETVQQRNASLLEYMEQTSLILPMDLPDEIQALYLRANGNLSLAEQEYAFDQALKRCQFFPKPAELNRFAEEFRNSDAGRRYRIERDKELDDQLCSRYRQARIEGREPKQLISMIEDRPYATAELMKQIEASGAGNLLKRPLLNIPAEVAARQGPEWLKRVQDQFTDLKKRAAAEQQAKP